MELKGNSDMTRNLWGIGQNKTDTRFDEICVFEQSIAA